jgi:outer membrane protein OmpA-like peptidoglycan-associated protein
MAVNLLEMMQGAFAPSMMRDVSRFLGESEAGTQSAVGSLLPALLGSFAQKAASPSGAADLFKMITSPSVDTNLVSTLGSLLGGGTPTNELLKLGTGMVTSLFGDRTGGFTQALAAKSGMKTSSVTNLLALAVPVIFAFLKKYLASNKMDAGGLAGLLLGQKDTVSRAVDSRLATALGLGAPAAASAVRPEPTYTRTPEAAATRSGFGRWLPWIVLAALAAFLLPQLTQCGAQKTEAPKVSTAPPAAPAPAPVVTSDNATVYFAVGSSTIPEDAAKTLEPVISKLRNEPATKALIAGYHSATGDLATNQELAKNRALAVQAALKAAGIAEDRLTLDKPMVAEANLAGEDPKARRVEVAVK